MHEVAIMHEPQASAKCEYLETVTAMRNKSINGSYVENDLKFLCLKFGAKMFAH